MNRAELIISELLRWSVTASLILLTLGMLFAKALIIPGLLLLICTPILRVTASILIFAIERERDYVLITITVLILVLLSFALGWNL